MSVTSITKFTGEGMPRHERIARNIAIAMGLILALGIVLVSTHMYTHIPLVVSNSLIGISSLLLMMSISAYLIPRCYRKSESSSPEEYPAERASTDIIDLHNEPCREGGASLTNWRTNRYLSNEEEMSPEKTQEGVDVERFQEKSDYTAKIAALFGTKRDFFQQIRGLTDVNILSFCEAASNYAKPALWGKMLGEEQRVCLIRMESQILKITAKNAYAWVAAQAYISGDQGKTWHEVKNFHPRNSKIVPFVQFIETWNPHAPEEQEVQREFWPAP